MKERQRILDRLMVAADLPTESCLFAPLLELTGENRVIIENHKGIVQYSRECISVSVSYGTISVMGSGLSLARMTKEQLVILGCIEGVRLCRRCSR